MIFEKIVSAKKSNDENYARVYANELAEIRKHNKMISNAKLSMEQIQILTHSRTLFQYRLFPVVKEARQLHFRSVSHQ